MADAAHLVPFFHGSIFGFVSPQNAIFSSSKTCPLCTLLAVQMPSFLWICVCYLCSLHITCHFLRFFAFFCHLHVSCAGDIALLMPTSCPLLHSSLYLQKRANWVQKEGNDNSTWNVQQWQKEGIKRAKNTKTRNWYRLFPRLWNFNSSWWSEKFPYDL